LPGSLIDNVEAMAVAAGFFDLIDHFLRRAGVGAGAVEAGADIADHDLGAFLSHQERDARGRCRGRRR